MVRHRDTSRKAETQIDRTEMEAQSNGSCFDQRSQSWNLQIQHCDKQQKRLSLTANKSQRIQETPKCYSDSWKICLTTRKLLCTLRHPTTRSLLRNYRNFSRIKSTKSVTHFETQKGKTGILIYLMNRNVCLIYLSFSPWRLSTSKSSSCQHHQSRVS